MFFLSEYFDENYQMPTQREVSNQFAIGGHYSVQYIIDGLIIKGFLTKERGFRNLRFTNESSNLYRQLSTIE
jgi:hypothetical protein